MTLYARAGERITCEAGHVVVTVAQDIPMGAPYSSDQYRDWQQPEPKQGMSAALVPCLVCGAPWFGSLNAGLHFEDGGWR